VAWELWKEMNARVFQHKFSTANMIITKIKEKANLWSIAGAKALSIIIQRE
jgi:hypothetical protein